MSSNANLIVFIYTGNRKYAGTDGTVHIILHGEDGTATKPIILSNFFSDNFEKDKIDVFSLSPQDVEKLDRFVKIERLELWKDRTLGILSDDWFVEKIVVENRASSATFIFPVLRWVNSTRRYHFKHLDTSLPQFDAFPEQRKMELQEKRKLYQYEEKVPGGVQIKYVPRDEQFSFDYKWDIFAKPIARFRFKRLLARLGQRKWNCFDDIHELYADDTFEKPTVADSWDSDIEFGRQRIASINPAMISLVKSVPATFPITDDLLKPLLEGLTIQEAIAQKRLFLCDLKILDSVTPKPGLVICKPIALFFVDKDQKLRSVAIQLFQEPGPDNPIFTPLDDPMLWKYVKMWYNNADSNIQHGLTHLALTHMLMEGIAIAANRNISPSHPVFKILAPHFLYLIAINSEALKTLINEGGWVDSCTNVGVKGMRQLVAKGLCQWRMDVNGLVTEELKSRGLDDPNVLPGYYYRDAAVPLFGTIKKYVTSYVQLYYTSEEMLKNDSEIQAFAQELVKERNKSKGGVGLKGVPGNGSMESLEDLVKILTCVIYTCSVGHASANFGLYDEYAFPPNYPSSLKGKPPTSKDTEITEKTCVDSLPDPNMSRVILGFMKVIGKKGTNSLGDFEVQYIFDPKAVQVVNEFRNDLKDVGKKLRSRHEELDLSFEYLFPVNIPNGIGV